MCMLNFNEISEMIERNFYYDEQKKRKREKKREFSPMGNGPIDLILKLETIDHQSRAKNTNIYINCGIG